MRVISCSVQNFGSYKSLEFNFEDQGLTLIQGATGSGKSTLCDIIPWILFGKTAKDGGVDEIRSWQSNDLTYGSLLLDSGVNIVRIRGNKANDLYFSTVPMAIQRGKDLNDTQKLINNLLGLSAEQYLSGAYLHEFSQTAQFFTTTAKNRRAICEQIVDLTLAKKLQEKTSTYKKELSIGINKLHSKQLTIKSNLELLQRMKQAEKTKASTWEVNHKKTIEYTGACYDKFEKNRKKIISNSCKACGTVLAEPQEVIDTSENPYATKLIEIEKEENPHSGAVKDFTDELNDYNAKLLELEAQYIAYGSDYSDLDTLEDVVSTLRSTLISNTIKYVESQTNDLLIKHFDAEIKVEFETTDNDKLEVSIQKDGNICSYTQLSKGQRQLLKLCFSVSIMQAVQNQQGVKFDQIFLDEALSGLDDTLKIKAFRLFAELATVYNSVFVIDHSTGLKELFDNKHTVELINGFSYIQAS